MSRIDTIFKDHRDRDQRLLMPFVVAGHPGLDTTEMVLSRLHESGAAIAEVGFPFSDPIADGPVIAAAMHEALESGVTVDATLSTISRVREHTDLGLIAMVSESIVHRRGGTKFIAELSNAGFDGLIIPDIDLTTADAMLPAIDDADLAFAMLAAPSTPSDRLKLLIERCRGFVYLLARTGLTGTRSELPDLTPRVDILRGMTDLPIAVGFGISTPDQVRAATRTCDAAIVGSALIQQMTGDDPAGDAIRFVETLATGLQAS